MTAAASSREGGGEAAPDTPVDLGDLLGMRTAAERAAAMAEIALDRLGLAGACPTYQRALRIALHEEPPPFAAVLYAEMQSAAAQSAQWTAVALIDKARRAGQRARACWSMAGRSPVEDRQLLAASAISKSRRGPAYLEVLDLLFPGTLDAEFGAALAGLSPDYAAEGMPAGEDMPAEEGAAPGLDELISLHAADLRAAFQHLMWRAAAAAHGAPDQAARIRRELDAILIGELGDVARSAVLIERRASLRDEGEVQALFRRCLAAFIRGTSEEPIDVSYHQRFGTYP